MRGASARVGSRFRLGSADFLLTPCRPASYPFVLGLMRERTPMLYAILCYNDEDVVGAWTKEEDDAVMSRLHVVHERWGERRKLGPAARLLPTTAATTLRKNENLVIDGPYAETKEQLLGFYVVDVSGLEEGLEIARELARANPGGTYELRPISLFVPGSEAP